MKKFLFWKPGCLLLIMQAFCTILTGGSPASKFSDYPSTALCFTIANDQASTDIPANSIELAIDNVRVVQGQ